MYDIVFYINGHVKRNRLNDIKQEFLFSKIINFDKTLTKTAENAKALCNTKYFWLINANSDFLNSMFEFNPSEFDSKYIHVFKLVPGVDECYLIPKNKKINKSQDYFTNVKYNEDYCVIPDSISSNYDIFFLSYNEPNSDDNWQKLVSRFPHAQRAYGEQNIYNSHKALALRSVASYFWVIDADNEIVDDFNFEYQVEDYDFDLVHIWHSRNEINDLEYGNGGIKLLPKFLFDEEIEGVDITTSLSNKIKIIPKVASINRFASSPWNAWRSAFRECVKLSSNTITRSVIKENEERLHAWTTKGLDRKFGEYVIPGAISGMKYGKENKGNKDALVKINDWTWLYEKFKAEIKLPFRPE